MEAHQKLEMLLDYSRKKILPFSQFVGQGSQTFYDIRKGKIQSFSIDVANKIVAAYPEINKEWLIGDEANMLKSKAADFTKDLANDPPVRENGTTKDAMDKLGEVLGRKQKVPLSSEGVVLDDDSLVENTAIVIPIAGQAGLASDMYDEILFKDLEKEKYYHERKLSGKYFKIEVKGHSMTDGTSAELKHGDWAYCRVLERRYWREKLYTHKWKVWCFFHNQRGIIFKCIKDYNIETGELLLESLNPDKEEYDDFRINISECTYICNVVQKLSSYS